MLLWKDILKDYTISLDTLSDIYWFLLFKFAKASKRFCRLWGLSGMRRESTKWPQRWVAAYVVTLPAGKGKGKGKRGLRCHTRQKRQEKKGGLCGR